MYTYKGFDFGFSLFSVYIHRNRHTYSLKQGQQLGKVNKDSSAMVQRAKDAEINMIIAIQTDGSRITMSMDYIETVLYTSTIATAPPPVTTKNVLISSRLYRTQLSGF